MKAIEEEATKQGKLKFDDGQVVEVTKSESK